MVHQEYTSSLSSLLTDLSGHKESAWSYLYINYQSMVVNLIKKNGGDEEAGKEIFQNVVIDLHKNIERGKLREDSNLKNYIYTLAYNQWRVYLRNNKGKNDELDHDNSLLDESVNFDEEQYELFDDLSGIISQLGEKCQDLILSKYSKVKMSMAEIAEQMGFANARSATSQLNKCMEKARNEAVKVLKSKEM
ncbi:sigma-70 family RNA polymerase sigma factor [Flammeovirga yaeyamensis]|uniref:Sigma-70 family RNA polymerase sigma factor n=1 Tax=Flammeovirga yaeyamensis TaxID=367791 RepID=A0AAX1N499_9BACT|nr:sigma-70 family RNA polymerase sigma factor [Flammeovirga yaeyamensis]MBB3698439.1 RNA polymerase sigma factor (sigma-70 family) [Flammeovirga yaeyamensis]NMF34211.1 sigma-70 family RNA polymerase sigma factor [Flammeovirga yaeyamensis]QWG01196.1 sigma-70 family RNA polymerase sigma factor [Flammeovirga yaeyamensis]